MVKKIDIIRKYIRDSLTVTVISEKRCYANSNTKLCSNTKEVKCDGLGEVR